MMKPPGKRQSLSTKQRLRKSKLPWIEKLLPKGTTRFVAGRVLADAKTGFAMMNPLSAETELALYRILQEALKNVEKHAQARHVMVSLRQPGAFVQLAITDDGIGFDEEHHAARRKGKGALGLLSMRERAAYVGGDLTVKSGPDAGTDIEVRIPLPPGTTVADASAA